MRNLFLLHLREQRRLTPKLIEERTGIPVADYLQYENTPTLIPTEHIELLSVLLRVKPEYLKTYCLQLERFAYHNGILALKDERIAQLTRALKRKIRSTPLPVRGKRQQAIDNRQSAIISSP